jgi:multidrug efflux pump subunit AcrA (membrane-fusion protein)
LSSLVPAAGLVLAVLAPALAAGQGGRPAAKVAVAPVESRTFSRRIELLGGVEPVRQSRPSAEVEGLALEVLVEEGDVVEEGDLILRLDVGLREIQRRGAEAGLRLAKEQLNEYRAGSRPEEILQAEQAMESSKALLEEARRDLDRAASLLKQSAISDQEFTSAEAKAKSADHFYQEKLAAYQLKLKGTRSETIARAEAEVGIRQAELDQIDDEIRRAEIRAPFPGAITAKLVEKGDYVRKGDPVVSIVQMHPIRVSLTTPESLVDRLPKGSKVEIRLDSMVGALMEGTIEAVIPSGDLLARTFPVKVLLENPEHRILPGMAARGAVTIPAGEPSLAVPTDALIQTETGYLVYVVRDGLAAMVPVVPGITESGTVAVRGTLQEGESVVVRGNERLFPETPVQIVTGEEP